MPSDLLGPRGLRLHPRAIGIVFSVAGLGLIPWVILLVYLLPTSQRAAHWDVAWAGFDTVLALVLLSVSAASWRSSPWLEGAATAAATLLFVDAWFDVLTSSTTGQLAAALLEAVFVEIPMAVFCVLIARSAEQVLAGAVDAVTRTLPGSGSGTRQVSSTRLPSSAAPMTPASSPRAGATMKREMLSVICGERK